jgi:hypothetical protein
MSGRCDKQALLENVLALASKCPAVDCNPEDCPLFSVRKLSRQRRLRWFKGLSEDELSYLCAYHNVCLMTRLSAFEPGLPA